MTNTPIWITLFVKFLSNLTKRPKEKNNAGDIGWKGSAQKVGKQEDEGCGKENQWVLQISIYGTYLGVASIASLWQILQ